MKRRNFFKYLTALPVLLIPSLSKSHPVVKVYRGTDPGAENIEVLDALTGERILIQELVYRGPDALSTVTRLVGQPYKRRSIFGVTYFHLMIARGPHKGERLEAHPSLDIDDCQIVEERRVVVREKEPKIKVVHSGEWEKQIHEMIDQHRLLGGRSDFPFPNQTR